MDTSGPLLVPRPSLWQDEPPEAKAKAEDEAAATAKKVHAAVRDPTLLDLALVTV